VIKWNWPMSLPDATAALFLLLMNIAPSDRPWLPKRSLPWRVYRAVTWSVWPLVMLPAFIFDMTIGRILERQPRTTNYGLLARRI